MVVVLSPVKLGGASAKSIEVGPRMTRKGVPFINVVVPRLVPESVPLPGSGTLID